MDKEYRKWFSRNIKYLLSSKGMSQRELARKIGLTEACMSRYCNGNRLPSVDRAVLMAQAMNVSIEELVIRRKGNGEK